MLPSAAAVLEDDDMLAEILLRLPPQPSSLPRASAVCKRWYSLASDPAFDRRFRRQHRRDPPLLGCFMEEGDELRFEPTLDHPNRLPEDRFRFPFDADDGNFMLLGCRHGFVLMLLWPQGEFQVWDPVNGHEHLLAFPPRFSDKTMIKHGAVLPAAHGDIQNFEVVLVSIEVQQRVIACVYSLETGEWGNLITAQLPPNVSPAYVANVPAVLVGDALYMSLYGMSSSIIEFNVGRQSLAVIPLPVVLGPQHHSDYLVMRAKGGGAGLLVVPRSLINRSVQLWKRKTDCDGVASWVLGKTIELDKLLSPGSDLQNKWGIHIYGFAEENNMVFLGAFGTLFMVQLDSLQFKKLPEMKLYCRHPFECVYAAE